MESANPPFSPFQMLYTDVLLSIFAFNADMFADPQALHTTRIASQVCRQWRDLMLDTPTLWGKLIDMDHISERRTDEWRNELIRRSGAALLWIRVESSGIMISKPESPHDRYIVQFLFDLVNGNWHRIQKLGISTLYIFELTRSMLCFPAPQLEHCEVSFLHNFYYEDTSTAPLFSNNAPMLRSIQLSRHYIDLRAPWLLHLHSMIFDDSYSFPDVLAVLLTTPSLQELKIWTTFDCNMSSSLPVVSLSHLKYLELNGFPKQCVAILHHVKIPADCSLSIRIHGSFYRATTIEENPSLLSIINTFTRHTEGAVQSHIDLEYQRNYGISLTWRITLPVEHLLSISILLAGDSDAYLLETFLNSWRLIPLDLTSVTKLEFVTNDRLNPCFGPFFSHLPSVEIISTDLRTLSYLAHLQKKYINRATKKPIIIFPSLQAIDLRIHLRSPQSSFFVNRVAAAFLLSRLQDGHPISTLDMSKHLSLDTPPKLHALAKVKGLKVLYRLSAVEWIMEHTCRSKDPEKRI